MMSPLDWVLSNGKLFVWLSLLMAVPSMLLYCAEMWTIRKCPQFHSSFYELFCIRAIAEILMTAASCYGNRLPTLFGDWLLPFYASLPNWALSAFYFLADFTLQADYWATAFLLLNRFTAIAMPIAHKKFWRKWRWLVLSTVLGIPLCTSCPVFRMQATLRLQRDSSSNSTSFVIFETGNAPFLAYSNLLKMLTSVLFLALCCAINAATFVAFKRCKQKLVSAQAQFERSLTAYAVLTFLGHVLTSFLMIFAYLFVPSQPTITQLVYINYPWITDLSTLVLSSWMLLWASKNFREKFIDHFWSKFDASNTTIVLPAY